MRSILPQVWQMVKKPSPPCGNRPRLGYNLSLDLSLLLKSVLMGLIEGLTEFLPISSTGHLILAGDLLGMNTEKGKVFEIVIQTGAMLAIVLEYRARFLNVLTGLSTQESARRFVTNVAVAFLPAVVLGLAGGKLIKQHLFQPLPVATGFIVGALAILWVERRRHAVRIDKVEDMGWQDALKVGCAQCLALFPGMSRSGSTIIGGLLFGLSRKAAAEFSFFLAIPTLMGAGAYDLYKNRALLSASDIDWFAAGSVAAFLSALVCVRWLLRYISSHDFTIFAWYRIGFGVVVLATAYLGIVNWTTN
ncbi:MAG: undecaprenyl-diphosphate phosphatase [Bryobacterales bacterium]|nr:undecaprenyl-diphosphate phosphatase [Bryobacterales bacterium]